MTIKIEKFSIKKYRCLEDFEGFPNGHSIIIFGENAIGKSTLIQFCQVVLGDKKELPVGLNAEGHLVVDKDGQKWKLALKVKDGQRTIVATSETGVKNSTVSFLSDFTGAISFNVWEFVKLGETESGQAKMVGMLKSLLSREECQSIDLLEMEIEQVKSDVTEKNRVVKQLQAQLDASNASPCDKPLDTSSLVEELQKATKVNIKIMQAESSVASAETESIEITNKINDLIIKRDAALLLKQQAEDFLQKYSRIDTSAIEQKISDQDQAQQKYHDWVNYLAKKSELNTYGKSAEESKNTLVSKRAERLKKIVGKSKLLDGLKVTDEGLYYNDVLVSDKTMSTSEIMMLGVRLKSLENPGFPIFLNCMESLGKEAMDALLRLSNENNFQLIGEEVRRGEEQLQFEIVGK